MQCPICLSDKVQFLNNRPDKEPEDSTLIFRAEYICRNCGYIMLFKTHATEAENG